MKAIKVTVPCVNDLGTARKTLETASSGQGFLFGYVDESAMRCIYFQLDDNSVRPLTSNEQRVEASMPDTAVESDKVALAEPWHSKIKTHEITRGSGDFRDAPMESFWEK